MRGRCLALCLGLSLVLAACGKQESAQERSTAAPAASVSAPAGSVAAAAAQQKAAGQASKITRMNEDGSETVDAPGDTLAHNPLLAAVASTVAASTSTASAATTNAPTMWQEGVNYTRLVPAQPTSVPAGQVEVLEFFWYACPHCYGMDPLIESWKKTKPAYITFLRVHVMWNDSHRALARLYYTLESMGKAEQLHSEIFKAIHVDNNPLVGSNDAESERIQSAFVSKFGVSPADFNKAYHSFAVETAMQRADELVQRYRVDGVPRFVVNGKYIVDVGTAGSPEKLIALVDDLAAQEHKH
jgi:protein dithiol oxidoreductase (disulfide-forming)